MLQYKNVWGLQQSSVPSIDRDYDHANYSRVSAASERLDGLYQMIQIEELVITLLLISWIQTFLSCESMIDWNTEYLAAGGNRHPSAADWDLASGLLAFGADRNVAIWSPLVWLISD